MKETCSLVMNVCLTCWLWVEMKNIGRLLYRDVQGELEDKVHMWGSEDKVDMWGSEEPEEQGLTVDLDMEDMLGLDMEDTSEPEELAADMEEQDLDTELELLEVVDTAEWITMVTVLLALWNYQTNVAVIQIACKWYNPVQVDIPGTVVGPSGAESVKIWTMSAGK